jgi:hypothetical protein
MLYVWGQVMWVCRPPSVNIELFSDHAVSADSQSPRAVHNVKQHLTNVIP